MQWWGTERPVEGPFGKEQLPPPHFLIFQLDGFRGLGSHNLVPASRALFLIFINANSNTYLLYKDLACLNNHYPFNVFQGCWNHFSHR